MRMRRAGSQNSTSLHYHTSFHPSSSCSSSTLHPYHLSSFTSSCLSRILRIRVRLFLVLCVLFIHLPSALCTAVNNTIDDTFGDSANSSNRPVFLPSTLGVWEDQTCKTCAIQPDKSLAFDGTWTAATYHETLGNISCTLSFAGTAIYIFFILANNAGSGITSVTEANFTLDGTLSGHFLHEPDLSSTELLYRNNAMVFSKEGLKNTDHQLIISTSGVDHDVFVNFDYAIYTFEDDSTNTTGTTNKTTPTSSVSASASSSSVSPSEDKTSSSSSNTGAIVGAVVGALVLIAGLIVAFWFYRRRRRVRPLSSFGGRGFDESGPDSNLALDAGVGAGGVSEMSERPAPSTSRSGMGEQVGGLLPRSERSDQSVPDSEFVQGSSLRLSNQPPSLDLTSAASTYHASSMYTMIPASASALTAASNGLSPAGREYDDDGDLSSQYTGTGTDVTSPMYQSKSVFSALPTGQVVLTAARKGKGGRRGHGGGLSLDQRSGVELMGAGASVTPALPSSGNLDSRFSRIGVGNGYAPSTAARSINTYTNTNTTSTPSNATTTESELAASRATRKLRLVTELTPGEGPGSLQPVPDLKAEIRHMRQRELERQMRAMKEEMRDLQREAEEAQAAIEAGIPRSASVMRKGSSVRRQNGFRMAQRENAAEGEEAEGEKDDVVILKDQIQMMSEQIALSQSQLQSPWAQGLSDEPPPGYSPPSEEPRR